MGEYAYLIGLTIVLVLGATFGLWAAKREREKRRRSGGASRLHDDRSAPSPKMSSRPPTEAEIVDALESAGYPFELRVYREYEAAEMDPVLSFRCRADEDDPQTKEIDVVARLHARQQYPDGQYTPTATVSLLFFTEVKKVHQGAFVAIRGADPSQHERRVQRTAPAIGLPCWQVSDVPYDSAGDLLIGTGGLAECFDPMNARPYCVQWATVKTHKSEKRFEAAHDNGCSEDFQRLIRSTTLLARDNTLHLLDFGVRTHGQQALNPTTMFYWPLLVLDTPVYTYDPATRKLEPNDWITLSVGADLGGRAYHRPIDVVSAAGLATIIEAYKRTRDRIGQWLETNARQIGAAAHGQVLLHRERRLRG